MSEGRAGVPRSAARCRTGWLFGHGCGGRGAVSVCERVGVSLVCGGLGDDDGESDGE